MKRAHVVHRESLPHQESFGGAFAEGLRRHGWQVTVGTQPEPCDLMITWGIRRQDWIKRQKIEGGEVCILERGYVGDRFAYTSVSFGGGLNGRGIFRGPLHDGSRWERHFAYLMKPRRNSKETLGYALIMGQVPGDQSLTGVNIEGFYQTAAEAYRKAGFETRFRPHPRGNGAAYSTLESVLAGAAVVVTWNSNSAVNAVLEGVPTVAMDRGSMAYEVAGHVLGEVPVMPDRTRWAHALAWKQWLPEEMRSGACWEAVGEDACERAA